MSTQGRWAVHYATAAAMLLAIACGEPSQSARDQTPAAADALRAVRLPALTGMTESVAEQIQERSAAVERERDRSPRSSGDYARAHGELGKVLLGAGYQDAAEPAFMNAAALDPTDMRWPYYLGHLYRATGALRQSAEQFERVLTLRPADVPTLVWLADAHLSEGASTPRNRTSSGR